MKSLSLLICIVFCQFAFSQYDGKDSKIASRYRPGIMWFSTGWRPANIEKPRKYDRLMVDLTSNRWVSRDSAVQTKFAGSIGIGINGMWDIPLNSGNGAAFGIGFAYRLQRIGYNGTILRDTLNQSTVWNTKLEGSQIEKSIYSCHQIGMPVEFRLRMKKWRHAKLHLGGFVGYRFNSSTKLISKSGKFSSKDSFFFDENPFAFGLHVRLGIRNVAVFGSYELSKPFKNTRSTQLNTVQLGLTFSLF